MNAVRSFLPNAVGGVDNVRALIQSKPVSHLISARSVDTLVARAQEHSDGVRAVVTALLVVQLVVVVLVLVTLDYSLGDIFPLLAMVEDDAPPSYAAVGDKEAEELEDITENKDVPVDDDSAPRPKPVTRSIRSIYRRLRSISGKRSLFRGLVCRIVYSIAFIMIMLLLVNIPFVPFFVAAPIASLLTSPLYTTWVHIVITEPSDKYFWHRIPRFSLVLRATALPTLFLGLVDGLKDKMAATMVSFQLPGAQSSQDKEDLRGDLLKSALMILIWIFIQIPLEVVLARIQASLLPKEDRTIIPLDNTLTLHRDEGKEYASMADAWKSFSRAAWVRLMNVYAMTIIIFVAVYVVLGCIAVAEFLLLPVVFKS
ncbi:hypothetical protein F4776DRAFT_219168 [Hypoxylon sp. NC0597]|nr:hypothetical protein F4776DRAFT_219168 [Hypoxylon sp. NC0597]